jgi:Pvc16 N-terminal domain
MGFAFIVCFYFYHNSISNGISQLGFMIDKVLSFLLNQLIPALGQDAGANEPNIRIVSVINQQGEVIVEAGHIALVLVNIEEERILKTQLPRERRNGGQVQFANPEIKLNLLIMLAANPGNNNYIDAVANLSKAMIFFQGKSFFDGLTDPGTLPAGIDQLSVELYSLSLDQQNQLWTSLGAKYLPSIVYKVRLVIIDNGVFSKTAPVIKTVDSDFKRIDQ